MKNVRSLSGTHVLSLLKFAMRRMFKGSPV